MRHAPLARSGFSPPPRISYRGLKLPRVSAALERSYLRRGAELPQVYTRRRLVAAQTLAQTSSMGVVSTVRSAVLARHPYRIRARDKWAARAIVRRRRRELEPQIAGYSEIRSSGLPV